MFKYPKTIDGCVLIYPSLLVYLIQNNINRIYLRQTDLNISIICCDSNAKR